MSWSLSSADRTFVADIEACEFPIADFDHQAHLRLAYIYLTSGNPIAATRQMEASLRTLLSFNGVDAGKFHVTLTRAWIFAVYHFMQRVPDCASSADFVASAPQLLNTQIMETHFSPELLFSETARNTTVYPDRDPIPDYAGRSYP
ncbi:MAG: hypothetical protein AAGG11_07350 [Pseudomonadota bacterium]